MEGQGSQAVCKYLTQRLSNHQVQLGTASILHSEVKYFQQSNPEISAETDGKLFQVL